MAVVKYVRREIPEEEREYLKQGDVVMCAGINGAYDFWGVTDTELGIISFDGGSNKYVYGRKLYLDMVFNNWVIKKRIPCEKAKITIEELD